MTVTQFAFRYRPVTWLLIGAILGLGLVSLALLPRREDPQMKARWIRITAVYPGASAAQVESLVCERLERGLLEVSTIKSVDSTCRDGQAVLTLQMSDSTHDVESFRQEVRRRVEDLRPTLPSGVVEVDVNDRFVETAAMIVGLCWPHGTPTEMETLAKALRDRLRNLSEVGEIDLLGAPQRQVEIALSAQRMAQYDLTPSTVASAIQNRNTLPSSAGSLAAGDSRWALRGNPLDQDKALDDLVVTAPQQVPVYLRDVASVRRTVQDPATVSMRIDGQPALGLSIMLRQGGNISALGAHVRQAMDATVLPTGASLHVVNDLPASVAGRMVEFNENLASGVALILAAMAIFMGARSAALVGALLPLTIIGTFAGMYLTGRDLQQISITALIIALGLVVDNSIVVVDNIERYIARGMEREAAAVAATDALRVPLLTSNLTTVASFAPLLLLSGGVGEFIADLGVVTTIATLVSLAFNLTVTPLLAARYLTMAPGRQGWRARLLDQIDHLQIGLSSLAQRALARPAVAATIGVGALAGAILILPHLGTQFFPNAVRNQFTIDVWLPDGRDIEATSRIARQVESLVMHETGVHSVVTYIGAGGPLFYYNVTPEATAANYAQLVVNTDDVDSTRRLVPVLQKAVDDQVTDARVVVRTLEQGPPIGAPVAVRLSGDDVWQLRQAGDRVRAMLASMPGVVGPYHNYGEVPLGLRVQSDEDRLALAGLSDADVAAATAMGLSGTTVSVLREGDEEIPIRLRLDPRERSNTDTLQDLLIPTRLGTVIPLRQVATLSMQPVDGRIVRRNHNRTLTVFAFTSGRLASDVLDSLRSELRDHPLPASIAVSYGGEQAEVDRTFTEMILILGLTVVANLVIVAWEFNDWAAALTIFAAIPLSLTGAVLGLLVARLPFGFMAFLGVTSLGGIVTNHAIVLFEYAREEQRQGLDLDRALLEAGRKRFRPILLTVLLSIGGLLPQAVNGGSLWPPMAWAMISGLLMSLLLTLVLVPSIYKLLRSWDLSSVWSAIQAAAWSPKPGPVHPR